MVDLDIISSVETEKALLGCLMVFPEMIDQVVPMLDVEHFYNNDNKEIYEAIISLRGNKEITYLSVAHVLGARLEVIGGVHALSGYLDYAAFRFEAREYARVISEKARARRIIDATNLAANELSAGASLEEIEHILLDLTENPKINALSSSYADEAMQSFQEVVENRGKSRGLSTGYSDLDRKMGGFDKGELTVLAGRPSMGKTALAIGLAYKILREGKSVFFASLEMTGRALVQRMAYNLARVDGQKYNTGEFTPDELQKLNRACDEIRTLPLIIDDMGGQSIDEVLARARQLEPDIVIIDYLQLMAASRKGMKLYEKTTENSLACKNMAKRLNIPILLLSQLSRAPETRGKSRRPQMSDLRESGAIEQDADHVWLLYRPEVYGIKELHGASTENFAELIVAKNRNGPIGSVKLTFLKQFVHFESYAELSPYERMESGI